MTRGKIIFVSGASSSGKSTLIRHVLHTVPNLEYFKTYTTRARRGEEVTNGSYEYQFVSLEEYESTRNLSSEWSHNVVHDNYYGSDVTDLLIGLEKGRNYISTLFPTTEKIERIRNNPLYDKQLIWISSELNTQISRMSLERPASELTRIETEKNMNFESLSELYNIVFVPEKNQQSDSIKFGQIINDLINL